MSLRRRHSLRRALALSLKSKVIINTALCVKQSSKDNSRMLEINDFLSNQT